MKKIRYLFVVGLIIGAVLFMTSCSADEQIVFVESTEEAYTEKFTEENATYEAATVASADEVVFTESKKIAVHICGAVMIPGVYELDEGSRVMDAVLTAGGFSEDADEEYINLATLLTDGDKIRIPTKKEVTEMSNTGEMRSDNGVTNVSCLIKAEENTTDKVNINTADIQELCTLPGIGQTRAESILAFRNEYGAFSRIEDIMKVSGIKESSFQKIKDKITVK